MSYITVAEYALWSSHDRDSDFDSDDPQWDLLSDLIASAQAAIDTYTGRTFEVDTDSDGPIATTRTFRWNLFHNDFSKTLLFLDEDLIEPDSDTLIDGAAVPSDIVWLSENVDPKWGALRTASNWANPTTITGYWASSLTAPEDIKFACKRLTKWLEELRSTTPGDAVISTPEGAVLLPSKLPADVIALLAPYKKLVISG